VSRPIVPLAWNVVLGYLLASLFFFFGAARVIAKTRNDRFGRAATGGFFASATANPGSHAFLDGLLQLYCGTELLSSGLSSSMILP
jgi:hypothetical protein